jgi:hypothetical protein
MGTVSFSINEVIYIMMISYVMFIVAHFFKSKGGRAWGMFRFFMVVFVFFLLDPFGLL